MRVRLKALFFLSVGVLLASIGSAAHGQISIPGFGQKNAGSNDQKANALLHQNLPLDLDANSAYPTVPNEDLLGGPFRGRVLPITLNTLTKPLPPGDYVLPMTFFCSEYSIHRPGAGTAYVLAPAKGTAAKAISTLLWRGMLTGHKPQELQSVSWAIQGSVAYDKMPANYKRLVDELIPDMKNQVNGQAFADIETGFQGKVNRATKKISDAIGKGTGGHVHADIKVDVELNQSFGRLGRLGKMALDGESINSIVTDPSLTDEQRTHALYAGQGTQGPPLPAANGPWSVVVPGVAYMRFTVHGGNLQSDNVMQIRILKPGNSSAATETRPHFVLAQYPQSSPAAPSVIGLVNGSVNQTSLNQCLATSTPQAMCIAGSVDIGGLAAFSVGTGAQSPLLTAANSVSPSSSKMCVKKVLYEPTATEAAVGLCIYLAAVKDVNNSCSESQTVEVADDQKLNWVQTYTTNELGKQAGCLLDATAPEDKRCGCLPNVPHKDFCQKYDGVDAKLYGPLYRPDREPEKENTNALFTGGPVFDEWRTGLAPQGDLQLIFRDIPHRPIVQATPACALARNRLKPECLFFWRTTEERANLPTIYENPTKPLAFVESGSIADNDLRLVQYPASDADPDHFDYKPLIRVRYGFSVDWGKRTITVAPLYIGSLTVNDSATESSDELQVDPGGTVSLDRVIHAVGRAPACRSGGADATVLAPFPINISRFPYDKP